jgi:hypothetical protein
MALIIIAPPEQHSSVALSLALAATQRAHEVVMLPLEAAHLCATDLAASVKELSLETVMDICPLEPEIPSWHIYTRGVATPERGLPKGSSAKHHKRMQARKGWR